MCNYPGIKYWNQCFGHHNYAHMVHRTAKQVISRSRKNQNIFKMYKNEKCMCKAYKNTVFCFQICKCVGFLLLSLSWLLKHPIHKTHLHHRKKLAMHGPMKKWFVSPNYWPWSRPCWFSVSTVAWFSQCIILSFARTPRACFSKVPKLFGCQKSLYIFNKNMFQALKLGSYFAFPCIWNILKEQLFMTSGS